MLDKPVIIVNGESQDQIPVTDRGFHYGDGVFETILVKCGQPFLLQHHLERLCHGCSRLKINISLTDITRDIEQALTSIVDHIAFDHILKIIVTRGSGTRGYLPATDHIATRVIILSASTEPAPQHQQGVRVKLCETKLSRNPLTAGLKHLNRLEQVIARSEWTEPAIAEGLMCDEYDNVIEGTMSNVFLVKDDTIITPRLDYSGVKGVMRSVLLNTALPALGISTKESTITLDALLSADEVFLSNSVFGIWPVIALEHKQIWQQGVVTQRVQAEIAKLMKVHRDGNHRDDK